MSAPTCVRCGRPTPDGYVCAPEAVSLAEGLVRAAGHAEDAEAVISRQTRHGAGSRGGSSEPMPVDLAAAERYRTIENTVGTWTRIAEDLSGDLAPLPAWPTLNQTAIAAGWLSGHVDDLRKHPAAGEAFAELTAACEDLARLVDRPADKELVGMCDCGKVLYAARGKAVIQCPMPTCKLTWDVAQSRDVLRRALGDKLVSAADAARFAAYWDERNQAQIAALIRKWAERSQILAHGELDDGPVYRFGDVADRLARTPRRAAARETAEMEA
jgi:hypothetical protein